MPLIINKLPQKPERIVTMGHADRYYYPPGATEPVLKNPEPAAPVQPEPQPATVEPGTALEPTPEPPAAPTEPDDAEAVQSEPGQEQESPKGKRSARKPVDK